MKLKVTRVCAGEYEVRIPALDSIGPRVVRVTKIKFVGTGAYWIAAARWDGWLYTDPLRTKRDAVRNAEQMLLEYDGGRSQERNN